MLRKFSNHSIFKGIHKINLSKNYLIMKNNKDSLSIRFNIFQDESHFTALSLSRDVGLGTLICEEVEVSFNYRGRFQFKAWWSWIDDHWRFK